MAKENTYCNCPRFTSELLGDACFTNSGRASLKDSHKFNGSMSVEAAMVVPLLMFAVLTIYVFFSAYKTQSELFMEQREKGRQICLYANLYENYLGFGDIVYLTKSKEVTPTVPVFFGNKVRVAAVYYAHAWTGYDISGVTDEVLEEEMVYITPNGEVYHRSVECTHLKLSIKETTKKEVGELRNADGGKYYPCEICGKKKTSGTIYITSNGDRYHYSMGCQGLKRTIEVVPISKVEGRRPCSKCGG